MAYRGSPLIGLPIIEVDTEENTWGQVINDYLTTRIEEAVHGFSTIIVGGSHITLDADNFVGAEAHKKLLQLTGSQTANINVIVPTSQRVYVVVNNTTGSGGDWTCTVKTDGGTGIALGHGDSAILYADGTNVLKALSTGDLQALSTNLTGVSDATPTDGVLLVGNGSTFVGESGSTLRTSIGCPDVATEIATEGGIEGGGDLSTTRTLSLTDTGVTAADYSLSRQTISLDAKGRITDIARAEGTINLASATEGVISLPADDFTVVEVFAYNIVKNPAVGSKTLWAELGYSASYPTNVYDKGRWSNPGGSTPWSTDDKIILSDSLQNSSEMEFHLYLTKMPSGEVWFITGDGYELNNTQVSSNMGVCELSAALEKIRITLEDSTSFVSGTLYWRAH